jgi:hypothetical protein
LTPTLPYNSSNSHIVMIDSHQIQSKQIITACARATTHIPSMNSLENKFKIPMPTLKNTF